MSEAIDTAGSRARNTAPIDPEKSPGRVIAGRCSWRLDDREMPVRAARKLTAEMLRSWTVGGEAEDAALLIVSELVSNALRYASPPIELALTLIPGGAPGSREVLIEVMDADPRLPAKRSPGESGGFGLPLVESLAKISFTTCGSGKTVRALLITWDG
ncbi:ATP-binding protein [Sphaerisporangium sp. NPDC088356]|uniref:ATP-binding protein n=1 Tax=Sphaerisporangium sp. NPDC088356 TaxID=3154871 RepID=UPI003438C847